MKKILLLFGVAALLLFSGCSSESKVDSKINGTFQVSLYDSNNTPIEGVYGDIPTMTHEEKAIFEGRAYILSGHLTTAVGVPEYFLGCTQSKDIHFTDFNLELEGTPFDVHFYEAPTVTTNGTLLTPRNLNRKYSDNSDMILYGGSTISLTGTQIFHTTDYGKSNIPGETVFTGEMILKPNTCYLFEILNNDGATADVTVNFIYHQSN